MPTITHRTIFSGLTAGTTLAGATLLTGQVWSKMPSVSGGELTVSSNHRIYSTIADLAGVIYLASDPLGPVESGVAQNIEILTRRFSAVSTGAIALVWRAKNSGPREHYIAVYDDAAGWALFGFQAGSLLSGTALATNPGHAIPTPRGTAFIRVISSTTGQQVYCNGVQVLSTPDTTLNNNDGYVGLYGNGVSAGDNPNTEAGHHIYEFRAYFGPPEAHLVVCDGNSLTRGAYQDSDSSYPEQLGALLGTRRRILKIGVDGQTTPQMAEDAADTTDTLLSDTYESAWLVAWELTNHIAPGVGDADAVTAYNSYVSYCQDRSAAGWRVIAVTGSTRDFVGWTPEQRQTFRDRLAAVNALIRTNWPTFASGLADVGSDANLGEAQLAPYLATTYFSDGTHLTADGYEVVAGLAYAAIRRAEASALSPSSPALAIGISVGIDSGAGGGLLGLDPAGLPGLAVWYDAAAAGTLWQDTGGTVPAGDSEVVRRWDDLSGNGRHAFQSGATVAPSRAAGGPGFPAAVVFDGVDDRLSVPDYSGYGLGDVSVWAVVQLADADTTRINSLVGAETSGGFQARVGDGTGMYLQMVREALAGIPPTGTRAVPCGDGSVHTVGFTYSPATGTGALYVDGVRDVTAVAAPQHPVASAPSIGSNYPLMSEFLSGGLSGLAVCEAVLTPAHFAALHRWARSHYAPAFGAE